ncbi:hypothetical protein ACWEXP_00965 [Staphylococcus pseudoxylosus]|uniref:Uncharacterized protein n=1 Tax=Staphylococcus pseudoxylosus TaxID=2282419 RepID=A0AAQ0MH29_9STAP|nr:hypothetical protein [Staphylococcus pseudoxylosus]MCE5003198.1 hypothetical protein [Staphylococcus pseudoxylosus]RMI85010.1 hypothetical protein D9V42_09135 [Staphylococcus pseudoxylosus]
MAKNVEVVYQDLLEAGWKMSEIDDAEIFEMLRILNNKNKKESKVKKVSASESLIGAITGKDPRASS